MSSVMNATSSVAVENNSSWWEIFVKEQYPNEKCLRYFKCSRRTYMFLIKKLKPYIAPKLGSLMNDKNLYLKKGVCIEKQVAILLYKLTTANDYFEISRKFNTHKTTIHKILYKSISAINKYLLYSLVMMPVKLEAESIARDFENSYEIPQIVGAMKVIHIPLSSPINLNYRFLNSRFYPSFVLQVVIDSNCRFRDVSVRHAGATDFNDIMTDSNIFKYSSQAIPQEKRNIRNVEVPFKIVGPSEGPHYSWLLNNYTKIESAEEEYFNQCLDGIRSYADSVIMKLRSRFLILSQPIDLNYKVVPQIIAACCIIHNICEREGDLFLEEWLQDSEVHLKKYPQPCMLAEWEDADEEALKERKALTKYISSNVTDPLLI